MEIFIYHINYIYDMIFNKRGQLGIIEFKFFMFGLIAGLIAALVLVALMNNGTIGFQLPMVTCSSA